MRNNTRTFRTLAATVAAGLIAAGGLLVTAAPAVAAVPGTQTFTSASDTAWVVPVGVTQVTYRVVGGEGGNGGQIIAGNGGAGGTAGTVTGTLTGLTAGQTLHIWAGQGGGNGGILFNSTGSGGAGYRTGGTGANGGTAAALPGGGGGGSSAIAVGAASPFVISAGGGGGGGRGGLAPLCLGRDGGDAGQAGLSANSAGCNNVQTGGAAGTLVANNGASATNPAGLNIIGASGGSGGGGAGGGAAGTTQTGGGVLTPRNNGGAGGGGGASLVPAGATFSVDGAETGNGYVQLDWLVEYPTTTVLTVDDDTPVVGQAITFTAVVTNTLTSDTPVGTVDFGVTGCNAQSLTPGPAAGQATATCLFDAGPVGPHSYHAEYNATADTLFASSSSDPIEVLVGKGDTTTLLAISDLTPTVGEQFSGTATVTIVAPADAALTGTVQFYVDDVAEGAPVPLTGNEAQLNFTVPDAGAHVIKAVYSGNDDLNGSEDTENIDVQKGDTTTTLVLAPNPAVTGQTVTATATIAVVLPAVATIDGSVEFFIDGVSQGSVTIAGNQAQLDFSAGAVGDGTKTVSVVYSGNDNLNGSNDAEDLTVNKGNTTTTLTLDPTSVIVGGDVEATAAIVVDAPAVAVIDGTVEFFLDGVSQGSAAVVAGEAVLTFPSGPVGDGSKVVTAVYSGDPDLNGSEDTADLTVEKGETTTTVVLDPTQVVLGGNVKATATIALVAPAEAPIDGFVDFWIGSNYMGTSAIDPVTNTAEYTFAPSLIGTFDITAIYTGNDDLNGSESDPAQLIVNAKPLPTTGGGDNAIWIAGGAGLLLIGGLGVLLLARRRQEA